MNWTHPSGAVVHPLRGMKRRLNEGGAKDRQKPNSPHAKAMRILSKKWRLEPKWLEFSFLYNAPKSHRFPQRLPRIATLVDRMPSLELLSNPNCDLAQPFPDWGFCFKSRCCPHQRPALPRNWCCLGCFCLDLSSDAWGFQFNHNNLLRVALDCPCETWALRPAFGILCQKKKNLFAGHASELMPPTKCHGIGLSRGNDCGLKFGHPGRSLSLRLEANRVLLGECDSQRHVESHVERCCDLPPMPLR